MHDCAPCPLKPSCCPNAPARKVLRSIYEGARDLAREIAKTDDYHTSRHQRKKADMLLAHLKRVLRLDRLRLRGPLGPRDEFHLARRLWLLKITSGLTHMPAMGYCHRRDDGPLEAARIAGRGVQITHAAREPEMAFLRQQLVVLKRSASARLRLRTADRLIFVWLYRLFPSVLEAAVVFKPETLVRWHRSGFRQECEINAFYPIAGIWPPRCARSSTCW